MQLNKNDFTLLADLPILRIRKKHLLEIINSGFNQKKFFSIFTPNSEQLVALNNDVKIKNLFKKASYLIPDSQGLLWASKKKYQNEKFFIKERITGVDLAQDLLFLAQKKQYSCLLIGGYDYQNLNSNDWLISQFKDLKNLFILQNKENKNKIYWWSGIIDKDVILDEEIEELKEVLKKVNPKIVFIALGFPFQEKFLMKYKKIFFENGVNFGLVVGGAFDMIFGKVKRAPLLLQKLRLEWLWRLIMEPWRIKRQVKLIDFIFLVLRKKI